MAASSDKFKIGKAFISATSPTYALEKIVNAVFRGIGGYICVSNVRTITYANSHDDYCDLMDNAVMCMPDGMPLVWMAKLNGLRCVKRTTGPDLLVTMLKNRDTGIRHFLLGDTDDTLNKIKELYKDSLIVGTYSPPFVSIEDFDYDDIVSRIKNSCADVVWISLNFPKQDFFAQKIQSYVPNKIFIGVGAGFRFASGEYKHPPKLIQKLGLTGFFWRKISIKMLGLYFYYSLKLLQYALEIILMRITK